MHDKLGSKFGINDYVLLENGQKGFVRFIGSI